MQGAVLKDERRILGNVGEYRKDVSDAWSALARGEKLSREQKRLLGLHFISKGVSAQQQ